MPITLGAAKGRHPHLRTSRSNVSLLTGAISRKVDNSQVCRADRDPPSWLHELCLRCWTPKFRHGDRCNRGSTIRPTSSGRAWLDFELTVMPFPPHYRVKGIHGGQSA